MFFVGWCQEDNHVLCKGFRLLCNITGKIYHCNCPCHEYEELNV